LGFQASRESKVINQGQKGDEMTKGATFQQKHDFDPRPIFLGFLMDLQAKFPKGAITPERALVVQLEYGKYLKEKKQMSILAAGEMSRIAVKTYFEVERDPVKYMDLCIKKYIEIPPSFFLSKEK
jgi:hypothetical protein